jgi:hypothetical protein
MKHIAGIVMSLFLLAGLATVVDASGPSLTVSTVTGANFVQAAGNTGTGTGTVTVTTGNIFKSRSGKILVMATISAEATSAGATITGQLVRDSATNIGSAVAIIPLSINDDFSIPVNFIDTAPDTGAHTYKFSVTAGAGNITCAATSAQIVANEL